MKKILTITIWSILLPAMVVAHSDSRSMEKEFNNYVVDLGLSGDKFLASETSQIDFSLLEKKSGKEIEFSDIWIRISKDGHTIMSTNVARPSVGKTILNLAFPSPGEYKVNLGFNKNEKRIVDGIFYLDVYGSDWQKEMLFYHNILIPGLVLALIALLFHRLTAKHKRSK